MRRFNWRHHGRGAIIALILALLPAAIPAQTSGFYHTVQPRETTAAIARKYGVTESALLQANRLRAGTAPAPGSRLWVPAPPPRAKPAPQPAPRAAAKPAAVPAPAKPAPVPAPAKPAATAPSVTSPAPAPAASASSVYTVRSGDTLTGIANRHNMTVAQLAEYNGISPRAQLKVGQRLSLAPPDETPGGGVARTTERGSAPPPPARTTSSSRRDFAWPVEGPITRRFTNRADQKFTGITIAVPRGTEVRAARDGKVVYVGDTIPGYGLMVIISHPGDFATCYAHNERLLVREGQEVRQGQVIARSGNSGRGGEAYLHFEIRKGGEAVNPEPYLP